METLYSGIYYTSFLCFPFLLYVLLFRKNRSSIYSGRDWYYLIKLFIAKKEVKKYQQKYERRAKKLGARLETEVFTPSFKYVDTQAFYGIDEYGNSLNFKLELGIDKIAEASLHLRLKDGGTYIFPGKNGSIRTTLPKTAWKVAGLNLDILEPFRKVRVTFNGLLKNVSATDFEKIEHVQFNFIFTSFGSPHYFPQDVDTGMFARALASDRWRDGSWKDNMIPQYGFEQLGTMQGFVKRDSRPEEQILNLPCNRCRCKGVSDRFLAKRAMRLVIADEFGNVFNIVLKNINGSNLQLNYGFAILSNDRRFRITDVDLQTRYIAQNKIIPDCIKTHVVVNNATYKIIVYPDKQKVLESISNTEYGYEYFTAIAACNVNVNRGRGLVEFWYEHEGQEVFIPKQKLCEKSVDVLPYKLSTGLRDKESQILDLVGGKGTSLALLSSLNSHLFTIPDGFIVTVNAYRMHVSENSELTRLLSIVNDICCEKMEGDLKEACNKAVSAFKSDAINATVRENIVQQLKKYPVEGDFPGWAVRSSAVGEDSDELSAAGQNETFLGCRGIEEVLNGVAACWSSLYTYQSVQYRWQHGVPVIADMGVVVQKMVAADAAGVLFTCHPSTSNPFKMVITSNFGLGETVVSGDSDPDTFVLSRNWEGDDVGVEEKILGAKNKVMRATSAGLKETADDKSCRLTWSISDEQAIELGHVGIVLENAFGNPRDIEWAFSDGKLFLLQSRAITTLNAWSDFELSHEMDTPLRTKATYFTTANIREVIPKATTVLSNSTTVQCTDWAIQKFAQLNFDPLSNKGIVTYKHNELLDVIISIHRNVRSNVHVSGSILDLAIFGHPVLNEEINDTVKNRLGIVTITKQLKDMIRIMINARRSIVSAAKKVVDNLKLNDIQNEDSALSIYEKINESLDDLVDVAVCHSKTSAVSVFFQVIAMNIMLEGKTELSTEHLSDFASILSSCEDVISAEVPQYLENIARIIKGKNVDEQFFEVDPSDGVAFLEKQCPAAYDLFEKFMDKHGHRSQHEFELSEPSWKENPTLIISMIKANVKNQRNANKETKSVDEIVQNLKSIRKNSTRIIIKFLMKRIRIAVAYREHTKSEMIRSYDKLRQSFRRLGQQMVREGLIPSKQLIYHLTNQELGSILQKPNPLLITKAVRRQKLYPSWKNLEFPEIMPQVPKAEDCEPNISMDSLTGLCKGTPVCAGIVRAKACVIKSLDEINQLETGDILITYSTDIGWSPYFPMLRGIVTELGGLVSHGAVVAREYGLPCIVGVQNVTKYFKTGDTVQLDGSKGELGKI